MIEDILIQYGTLGLWVAYMIIKERTYMKEMKNALKENTNTLVSLREHLELEAK